MGASVFFYTLAASVFDHVVNDKGVGARLDNPRVEKEGRLKCVPYGGGPNRHIFCRNGFQWN